MRQPPTGGCVLKHKTYNRQALTNHQPPTGGCVLKPGVCLFT
ncbi:hypothetical protein HMPREF9371_0958 [Neisseria shayeganii 871]|uniref:Uncharacterized protein n=1 Tax=Neisseria shayeganii 871 TaxID=1032488 RepID=G4CH69_9NEIS|nr:hypothetical protein HMPREF9371_0958 [Neisseria shayeganii 871]